MSYELIAQGGLLDAFQLGSYEALLDEGQRGLLEFDLRLPVSQSVASELENQLRQAGVEDVRVTTASQMLRVFFRKGFPWLVIIAGIILGIIILAIMITGWRIYRELFPEGLPAAFNLALIAGVIVLAIVLARRR